MAARNSTHWNNIGIIGAHHDTKNGHRGTQNGTSANKADSAITGTGATD